MKKCIAVCLSALMIASMTSCGDKKGKDSSMSSEQEISDSVPDATILKETEAATEAPTEAVTEHISPVETVTASFGIQLPIDKTISRQEGSNTIKIPLSDLIEEGDSISSFTFVIYSADDLDIGEFKGGCGISVNSECSSATDEGWFQSDDFSAPTDGTYGEITWNVPADVAAHVSPAGDLLFGYWWGNSSSIRIENVICSLTRSRDIPCDGTVSQEVGKSVNYSQADNKLRISTDFLPEDAVPQAVTYNISSNGGFGKFTGAFGYDSSNGYYQSPDVAEFTSASSISLTWILPDEAKRLTAPDGEIVLGYWWSEQDSLNLDSISVKYSLGGVPAFAPAPEANTKKPENTSSVGFRSSAEIVKDIKVGWNLGNTLDSYDTGKSGLATETGWGNLKTTAAMIKSVKDSGFNAIRVPVTWDEHMDGDTIQKEWLDRVQEIVDYAYNSDMYVILNMHHDDYIWFEPSDSEYSSDSAKLKKIWEQISERFKDYDDKLLFEGMNEPRTVGSAAEWMGGTSAERAVINKYEQDFVNTVRSSGGNNSERSLIITSYAASAEDAAMNDVIVPNDSNIIVSLHYYAPWKFSDGQSTTFGDPEKSELDAKFDTIKKKFIDKGTPVIIGEFGCVAVADDQTRSEYYKYYISAAKARGIKCFVWDNGISKGESAFGIFNRGSLTWNDAILNGITDGSK